MSEFADMEEDYTDDCDGCFDDFIIEITCMTCGVKFKKSLIYDVCECICDDCDEKLNKE